MSNKSLEYPNSTPSQTSSDVLEQLAKITGIPVRKRIADEATAASTVPSMRKAVKMGSWVCSACNADNSEAVGNRCGACGTRTARLEKRDSIASKSSSSLNSLTIDELVGNLEGLEFDVNVDTYNSPPQPSSLNASLGESSATSRFSQGNWSLRDLEKWPCSMCTYENEPLFCACEMCGTGRPPVKPTHSSRVKLDTTRAQQEQRLSELLQFRKPVAVEPAAATTANEAPVSSIVSSLPPLGAMSKLSITTKAHRGSGKGGKVSPRPPRRVYNSIPTAGMDDSLAVQEFSADISKPHQRRSYNPEDSNATEATFNMDMSASMGMLDDSWYGAPSSSTNQQHVAIYPGIAEEEAS